jgi:hypothetical protein
MHMAEAKKPSTSRSPRKSVPAKATTRAADVKTSELEPTLLAAEMAIDIEPVPTLVEAVRTNPITETVQMVAEATPQVMRHVSRKTEESREILRAAMRDAAKASTRGALEVNGKVIEALRIQSEVALDLWQSTLKAGSVPEAMRLQTTGMRTAYETAAAQWKDIAATTTRWFGQSVEPIQAVWTHR